MFWKLANGNYVSATTGALLSVVSSAGVWTIRFDGQVLAGEYASEVDARQAMDRLCQGFDPGTLA